MTLDRWIALISSLSALGAALATLFMLFEMRRQRHGQNLVSFFVPGFQWTFKMSGTSDVNPHMASFDISVGDRRIGSRFPCAQIVNLGRAPAATVIVKSSYRLSDIQTLLAGYRDSRQLQVADSTRPFILLKTPEGEIFVNRELDGLTLIDFVAPTTSKDIGRTSFKLPLIHLTLFGQYLRLLWEMSASQTNTSLQQEAAGLFTVTLTVTYKDIGGLGYTCSFIGEPSLEMMSEKEARGGWTFKKLA